MDFTTSPPNPLELNKSPEYYESILQEPFRMDLGTLEALNGAIDFGDSHRYVHLTIKHNQCTEIEIRGFFSWY